MAEKDNMKVNTSPVSDVETGTAEDVEAIMKKYDRESNTRVWEGVPKQVIRYLLAAFSLLMPTMGLKDTSYPRLGVAVAHPPLKYIFSCGLN